LYTLQEPIPKIRNQIFPEKELRGHSPSFHIQVSVTDLYIPMIDLSIMLQEICWPILEICKSLKDTYMNMEIKTEASKFPKKGKHKWDFRCTECHSNHANEKGYKKM
jgi:hypothetical protein